MTRVLYRFTRDLRLEDHAGLAAAARFGAVVPVFIIDKAIHGRIAASPHRAAFFCGAIRALDTALRERGSQLIVRRTSPGRTLKSLAAALEAHAVAWSSSFDEDGVRADQTLQSQLEEAGLRVAIVPDAPAIAPEETTAARSIGKDGYRSFRAYYDVWRSLEPASYEAPLLLNFVSSGIDGEPLPQPSEFNGNRDPMRSGLAAARSRLERFLSRDGLQYAAARSTPSDECGTSHLGADLSFGTIGARTIVREVRRRMDDPFLLSEERNSLKLFLRSIAFRDFFLQLALYNPQTQRRPLQEKMRAFPFARSHEALDAWCEGKTGYPLVDAGIRQLRATGWMHPYVRAVAASFLCFDLGADWRTGMAAWDRYLIEDEPALALGNWQWIAGVGADLAAYPRIYNPRKQARRFDPEFAYVKQWVPELANVSPASLSANRISDRQVELPLYAQDAYPQPVVDHERAARVFLQRYRDFTEGRQSP